MSVSVRTALSWLFVCSSVPEVTVTELLVVEVHVAPEPTAMAPAASSVASGTSTLRLVVAVMGVPL